MLTVEILVQAVVIALAIMQEEWVESGRRHDIVQETPHAHPDSARQCPEPCSSGSRCWPAVDTAHGAGWRPLWEADRRSICTRRAQSRGAPSQCGCETAPPLHSSPLRADILLGKAAHPPPRSHTHRGL